MTGPLKQTGETPELAAKRDLPYRFSNVLKDQMNGKKREFSFIAGLQR